MNQKEWENAHYKRIQKYVREIRDIFNKAANEAAKIGVQINQAELFDNQLFKFENFPKTQEAMNQLLTQMHTAIETVVTTAISKEWQESNSENDSIAQRVLGIKLPEEASEKFQKYFNKNIAAQEAFINRKESGLNLSERVWKYVGGFKSEIEAGLDVGIRDGLSAAEMARDLKKYLQEPERLYRRVRDKHGNLVLSKAARAYNPGRGVYRSSYKNALRLTRTETNMAYRAADHERQKQLDFVVGIEVRLTNNPGHIYDICDELKGKYPKDFKFVGWHPNCMCHAVTILKTPEELAEDIDKINRGEKTDTHSQNEVTDLPQNFKDWAVENQDRIASAKNQPYFIRDNFKGTDVNKWFTSTSSDQPEKQMPASLTIPKPAAGAAVEIPESTVMQVEVNDESIKAIRDKYGWMSKFKNQPDEVIRKDIEATNQMRIQAQEYIKQAKKAGVDPSFINDLQRLIENPTTIHSQIEHNAETLRKEIENKTATDKFLKLYNETKNPITTPEEAYNTRETKTIRESAWEKEDDKYHYKTYHSKSENYETDTYYRIQRPQEGESGMGKGLYVGRDKYALENFYNIEKDGVLQKFEGKPKWLDLTDPRRDEAFHQLLKQKGIDPNGSEEIGKFVKSLGFDGIRYYDVQATGDEYILFNTDKLKQVKLKSEKWELTNETKKELREKDWIIGSTHSRDGYDMQKYNDIMKGFDLVELDKEIEATLKGNGIKVTGKYLQINGNNIEIDIRGEGFVMQRTFQKGEVSHDLLRVKEELQGNGMTKNLFKLLYKQYQAAGIKEINLHANIDVGGYAWARYGFNINARDIDSVLWYGERNLKPQERDDLISTITRWKKSNPNAEEFPMRILADKPYGKSLLLGSDWKGRLNLTDASQRKIFENYLFKGK